jgi:hypothetical protein
MVKIVGKITQRRYAIVIAGFCPVPIIAPSLGSHLREHPATLRRVDCLRQQQSVLFPIGGARMLRKHN